MGQAEEVRLSGQYSWKREADQRSGAGETQDHQEVIYEVDIKQEGGRW